MGLLERLRGLRRTPAPTRRRGLPDPAQPPGNRGQWEQAALTNVEITELIKGQLRTSTRPWEK